MPVDGFQLGVLWGGAFGGSTKQRDPKRLGNLMKKASSVIRASQDSVATVAERKMGHRNLFGERLLSLRSFTERLRRSFLSRAILGW